jgi:hypothetical protein
MYRDVMRPDMSRGDLETRILTKIAQGSKTFYALTVKHKVGSNDGVLAALERLTDNGYIEKGPTGSRRSQPYYLKEDGFDVVLRYLEYIDDFDTFAKTSGRHFPLVFNHWDSLAENGLREWVITTMREQVKKIDAVVMSQLIAGDRSRYSHEEFVNDLTNRIYGPWPVVGDWSAFVMEVPIDRIRAFLMGNPEVMRTRQLECEKLNITIEALKRGNISYQKMVLNDD